MKIFFECIPSNSTVEDSIDSAALAECINSFLLSLPPLKRAVFVRRYWYAGSIADIAEQYRMSESKVKSLLFRLRRQLQKNLEKNNTDNNDVCYMPPDKPTKVTSKQILGLTPTMTYPEIVTALGETLDTGSGIYILLYEVDNEYIVTVPMAGYDAPLGMTGAELLETKQPIEAAVEKEE